MTSYDVDSVIRDLDLLQRQFIIRSRIDLAAETQTLKLNLQFLETFLVCARKWRNSGEVVGLQLFLSNIEVTVNKLGRAIQSLRHVSEEQNLDLLRHPASDFGEVVPNFLKNIESFKREIIKLYSNRADFIRSSQSNSCMGDEELVCFIDSILQNLVDFLVCPKYFENTALLAQIEALEDKLTFLKNFIRFAKLRGVQHNQFEDLLIHTQIAALLAARLSYMCLFSEEDEENEDYEEEEEDEGDEEDEDEDENEEDEEDEEDEEEEDEEDEDEDEDEEDEEEDEEDEEDEDDEDEEDEEDEDDEDEVDEEDEDEEDKEDTEDEEDKEDEEDEEVRSPEMCSLISDLLQKIKPINLQICEIYIQVLRASKSPSRLHTEKMDKRVVQDFNDSIISCLWELLCGANFLVSVKDQMQILYEGLRFLRSILREPHEKMDALTENIVALIGEAGIVICSLFVREVDVDSTVVRDSPDCCAALVSINSNIEHIKVQISSLSATGIMPSYHSFNGQEIHKTSHLMPSKSKIPVTNEVVVGFDKDAEILIDRLVGGSRELEIIPITGMPGLGKTTLAKKVYNNPSTLHYFHIRLWCVVSQVYNKKNLLIQILCSDGKHSRMKEELNNLDEHELLKKLYQKLRRNKYLVVFDDVWDVRVWDDLRHAFPNDKNGSRILFTSRISHVFSQVEFAGEPHNLRPLNDRESWELIQKKVFGKGDCPQALHEIGMKIAKTCKGLPLTVVTVAGILATIEYDGWDEVAESLTSTTVYDTDLCRNTLELSYMHLPHYLKPCLLYFGAFREDQEIQSKKLMWLWIAEGLVQNTDPKILEDLAEEYMLDLIGRNLVMVAKQRSRGGVKACQIHDLLHEFCKAKAKEENFLQVLHGYDELSTFNEPPNLRRLSIWSNVDHFKKSRLFCPHISSLLLLNRIEESKGSDAYMADVTFIICIYKGLRVLDLEQIFLRHNIFPREVESLVELRYLGVRGKMRLIPPSIANLSNLETFRVINDFGIVSLPKTIWNMTKLRHLHIGAYQSGCSLPSANLENNSCLLSLDTFSTLSVPLNQRVENMSRKIRNTFSTLSVPLNQRVENMSRKIRNVRELKIQLEEVVVYTTTCDCNFSGLESLESLEISVGIFDLPLNHVEFSFPTTLKKLVLRGLKLPWSKITLIEKLPNLEVLKLLFSCFFGEKWELTEGGFLKLIFLSLKDLDVVEWTDTGSDDHFPCLQKLLLSDIFRLESVPSCLERISNLEVIEVRNCKESVKDLVRKIEEEQQSYGNENLKVLIRG